MWAERWVDNPTFEAMSFASKPLKGCVTWASHNL